jgi:hypothetical protein
MAFDLSSGELAPGTYRNAAFHPVTTLTVGEGWSATLLDGFFDVQLRPGTPEVIAVQVARVVGVPEADGSVTPLAMASTAAGLVGGNGLLTVLDRRESLVGGRAAHVVEVRNNGELFAPIIDIPPGRLGINPGRALWLAFLEAEPDGLLAVMVGGPTNGWPEAFALAEPVLASLRFDP